MIIKLAFDPNRTEEANVRELFLMGGLGFKFWALWRRNRIVDQYFTPFCLDLAQAHRESPIETPFQLLELVFLVNHRRGDLRASLGFEVQPFIIEHWDFFSPAIRRKITYQFECYVQAEAFPANDDHLFRELLRGVMGGIIEAGHADAQNAPGHMHDVAGIWDDGGGPLAGTPCHYCQTWMAASAALMQPPAEALAAIDQLPADGPDA